MLLPTETGQAELDNKFERDIIDPLIKLFDGIDLDTGNVNEHIIDDLNAALNKENNGSVLCQASDQFRKAFTALAQSEAVFNPNHLLKALEKYEARFNAWYVNENNPHRWLRLDLFWRQVIGFMQRFLPANYGQAFCTGLYDMVENDKPLERRLDLHNYVNGHDINLFPLDDDSSCRLDFAVYGGVGERGGGGFPHFKTYVEFTSLVMIECWRD